MTLIPIRVPILTVVVFAFAVLSGGCDSNPVGNKCFIADAGVDEITQARISSGAVDCISRLCLSVPTEVGVVLPAGSEETPLCTGGCSSDSDCDRVSVSPCQSGFTCRIQMSVGPFCCRKLCVCKDFFNVPDAGVSPTPPACDPDNADNTCCNLPGRGECSPI